MSDIPSRDRISMAAILVRNAGYPDVCAWMLTRDKQAAHKTRVPRAHRADVVRDGRKVRGSKAFVNLSNPDIVYTELDAPPTKRRRK